jgi:hypothetical protein
VEMSGQQEIEATSKKAGQCIPGAASKVFRVIAWWQIERVMGYDDSLDAIGKPTKLSFHSEHLPVIDAAAFEGEPSGRIDASNCDFIIEVEGLQVVGNILLIDIEPVAEPGIDVVQRNIVISRHNDLRCRKCPQKRTGSLELTWPGTLRQIARNGDYVRLYLMDRMNQLFDDSGVCPAEVHIGNMD